MTVNKMPLRFYCIFLCKISVFTCLITAEVQAETCSRGQLKCDNARAETRFHLSSKQTSSFKSARERQFS